MKYVILALSMLMTGCVEQDSAAQSTKQTQAQKAKEAANSIEFTENAEIDNIKRRLELTANPGLLGYVILLNEMGQPVMYTGVKGKITSGKKRLTPTWKLLTRWNCGGNSCDKEVPAESDEGTYGESSDYVYFWTPAGQYMQWNGKYLYSDKPFRLTTSPLVVMEVK